MNGCKHGETSIVCSLCDQELIDKEVNFRPMSDEEFAKTCPPEPPTKKVTPQTTVSPEDWLPEMGWEEEDL